MKKLLCIFAALAITVSLLAGCGGANEPYEPTGDALGDNSALLDPQGQSEQSLTLAYYRDQTLNPLQCHDYTNRTVISLLYQGLFCVSRDYKVEPVLCKSYKMSQDMKSYTFYPESVKFTNGAVLTATDVAASLQAAKASRVYSGRFTHIQDISVTEDGGVLVQLDTPMENLPILLDIPIIPGTQLESSRPAGTGPYVLDETGDIAKLRRRSDWWCSSDLVVTAQVVNLVEASSNPQIRDEFQFGQVNIVCADPGSDKFADFRSDYELWNCENGIFLFLACNMDSAVFSDPQVRAALTYAIDREQLVDTHYRGYAHGVSLPASPNFPYYNQNLAEKYAFAEGKFAEAVTAAGMKDQPIVFVVNGDDSLRVRVARSIRDMLTQAGLVVELRELSADNYIAAVKVRNFDIYLGQTVLSPNMDLSEFFHTYGDLSFGGINDVGAYTLCLEALANYGNYYSLYKYVMDNGLLCPVLFRSYAVYGTRGHLTELTPARDNIFYYSVGKDMEHALLRETEE